MEKIPSTQTIKTKKKYDYIKLRSFCPAEGTGSQQSGRKYLKTIKIARGLISRICKELRKIDQKKKEILSFATKWMQLEVLCLVKSVRPQKKNTCVSLICGN